MAVIATCSTTMHCEEADEGAFLSVLLRARYHGQRVSNGRRKQDGGMRDWTSDESRSTAQIIFPGALDLEC